MKDKKLYIVRVRLYQEHPWTVHFAHGKKNMKEIVKRLRPDHFPTLQCEVQTYKLVSCEMVLPKKRKG